MIKLMICSVISALAVPTLQRPFSVFSAFRDHDQRLKAREMGRRKREQRAEKRRTRERAVKLESSILSPESMRGVSISFKSARAVPAYAIPNLFSARELLSEMNRKKE